MSGARREGMFSAVKAFALKAGLGITTITCGLLLKVAGFDQEAVALRMKLLIVGLQVTAFVVAILIFQFYPITRERAAQTRRILDDRKRLKAPEAVAVAVTVTVEA